MGAAISKMVGSQVITAREPMMEMVDFRETTIKMEEMAISE